MSQHTEKMEVAEVVTRIFHALDAHDWETISTLSTNPVDLDYPSKEGGPESVSTADFIAGLKSFLPGFDATQHLLGPIVVDMHDDTEATARVDARVTHLLKAADDPIWVIGCHYTSRLKQQDGNWKVYFSRAQVIYEEGNRALQTTARQRALADVSRSRRGTRP